MLSARRTGATLLELLVALLLTGIVTAALLRSRAASHDAARDAIARGEARRQLRAGVGAVLATLRGASPAGGDLLAVTDTALELHVTLGATVWCGATPALPGVPATVTLLAPTGSDFAAWLDAPASGDAILVLVRDATEWRWHRAAVAGAGLPVRSDCAGAEGRAASRVPLVAGALLAVPPGSPARLLRRARWSVYRSRGRHFLGWRDAAAGGVGLDVVQPVSGPHDVRDGAGTRGPGLAFGFLDETGAPTWRAADVATVVVRGRVTAEQGVGAGESLAVASALRNVPPASSLELGHAAP